MLKLSIRNLLAHKIRFFMTSFAVVIGVAFVVGSLVVTDTVRASFDTLFAEINQGVDLQARTESSFDDASFMGTREPMSEELVDQIAAVDGVEIVEGSAGGSAQPIAPDGELVSTTGAPLLGFTWGENEQLAPVSLESGEIPDAPGEIAIDQGTFEEYDFSLGDEVAVVLAHGQETFTLVGTAKFGESNSLAGARLTLFEPSEGQRVFDREGQWDEIYIGLEPGADVTAVRDAIADVVPDDIEIVTGDTVAQEGADSVAQFTDIFGNILLGFAAVALFVSAFYIYNTFSIILGQRIKELALLRAIGASASQVRRTVILEALLIGILSSAIGIGIGMLTAMGLRGLMNAGGFGLPADSLVLETPTVIAAVVVGIGVTLAASIIPARKAAQVSPMAALRDGMEAAPGSRRLRLLVGAVMTGFGVLLLGFGLTVADGAPALLFGLGLGAVLVFLGIANLSPLFAGPVARILGAPVARFRGEAGKLARENATRNPYRTASTASALVIGLALVTTALVIGTSVKESFGKAIDQTVSADFIISEPTFSGFSPTLAEELQETGAFDAVAGVRFGRFRIDGNARDLVAAGPEAAGTIDIDIQDGGSIPDLGADGIMVHEDPAGDLGLSPGDEVEVEFSATGTQTFTVVGIHADATFAGNYLISLDAYEENFTRSLDQFVFATTAEGVSDEEAAATVAAATEEFPQLDVEDRQEFLESQQSQVDQILITVNVLLLLAVVIAVLGIGNTLALSVFERTRELGLLRAVGMSRRQTRRMIRWESAIVSLFGAVLGVIVGIAFGLAATTAMPESFLTTIAVPGGQLIILVLVAVIAGLLAAIMPARRAARLDVLKAIATE